jgi:hypothetical protein
MTSLGKALVFVNLALSLVVAAWAQGIYSNRINWSNDPMAKPEGEMVRRLQRVKELTDHPRGPLGAAGLSWNEGRATLAGLDQRRADDRAWYDAELAFDRSGANQQAPARVVKLDKGQPVLAQPDPNKPGYDVRPVMESGRDPFGQPLLSLVAYGQEEEAVHQQINQTAKEIEATAKEDESLTNQLAGDPNGVKGLQHRILDARAKMAEAITEQRFVRPLLINAVVNSDLVFKRQRELETRIKELEKVGVAGK